MLLTGRDPEPNMGAWQGKKTWPNSIVELSYTGNTLAKRKGSVPDGLRHKRDNDGSPGPTLLSSLPIPEIYLQREKVQYPMGSGANGTRSLGSRTPCSQTCGVRLKLGRGVHEVGEHLG